MENQAQIPMPKKFMGNRIITANLVLLFCTEGVLSQNLEIHKLIFIHTIYTFKDYGGFCCFLLLWLWILLYNIADKTVRMTESMQ